MEVKVTKYCSFQNLYINNVDVIITKKLANNTIVYSGADGLEILIHQKRCEINNLNDCIVQKLDTKLAEEIKLAILKRAVQIDKKITEKKVKDFKKILGKKAKTKIKKNTQLKKFDV